MTKSIKSQLHLLVEDLYEETHKMTEDARKKNGIPVLLLAHIENNDYVAYDLFKKRIVILKDYKEYRKQEHFPYMAYHLGNPLNRKTGMGIDEDRLHYLLPDEDWEPRPEYIPTLTEKQMYCKDAFVTYVKAIVVINREHQEKGHPSVYRLERRMRTFEKLHKLGAPECIINNQLELINKLL